MEKKEIMVLLKRIMAKVEKENQTQEEKMDLADDLAEAVELIRKEYQLTSMIYIASEIKARRKVWRV